MSRTDILEDIKKAEADAKVKVEQAEADKKAAIANARRASVEKIQNAGVIYNLAGQKVSKSFKGLIIKNGKKYFVK